MKKIIFSMIIMFCLIIVLQNVKAITPDELRANPSLAKGLSNEEFVNVLNQDVSLLYDDTIFGELYQRSLLDVNILNNNPKIKEIWIWRILGMNDGGTNILSLKETKKSLSSGNMQLHLEISLGSLNDLEKRSNLEVLFDLHKDGNTWSWLTLRKDTVEGTLKTNRPTIDSDGSIDGKFFKLNGDMRLCFLTENLKFGFECVNFSGDISYDGDLFKLENQMVEFFDNGQNLELDSAGTLKYFWAVDQKTGERVLDSKYSSFKINLFLLFFNAKLLTHYFDTGKMFNVIENCPIYFSRDLNDDPKGDNSFIFDGKNLVINIKNGKGNACTSLTTRLNTSN